MNKVSLATVLLLLSLTISSCFDKVDEYRDIGKEDATKLDEIHKDRREQIMSLHDDAMPLITEMRSLEQILRKSIQKGNAPSTYAIAADSLRAADKAMMQWMGGYDPTYSGTSDEVKAYLDSQFIEISRVKNDVFSSINYSKSVIELE